MDLNLAARKALLLFLHLASKSLHQIMTILQIFYWFCLELGFLDPNSLFDCTSALDMAFTVQALLTLLHLEGLLSFELAKHVKSTVHGFLRFGIFN